MNYDFIKNEELNKQTEFIDNIVSKEGLIVLSKNPYARTLISEKYNENPELYYECYIRAADDKYLSPRKSMLDIEEESAYNKLVGIVLYDTYSGNIPDFRKDILFKCYNWIYRHIKNSYSCDIQVIIEKYLKKNKISKVSRSLAAEISIISLSIASIEKKPLEITSFELAKKFISFSTEAQQLATGAFLEENKTNRLYDVFPEDILNIKKFNSLDKIVSYIFSDAMNDSIMSDAMAYFDTFLNSIGLDSNSMTNVPYTEEDVKILTHFLNYDKGYILSEDSKKAIVSALFIILAMKKKYFQAKDFTLNIDRDREYRRFLELKGNQESKEKEYENEIERLKKELSLKDKEIENLKSENISLEKSNRLLNQKIESIEDNTKEVIALREAIYSLESEDINESSITIEEKLEFINNRKIVVFGGSDSWVNNIKDILPNVKFITDELKNLDISFLKNIDFVFINVKSLSHSFYYKIMSVVRKNNVNLFYIDNSNKEMVVDRMYSLLLKSDIK